MGTSTARARARVMPNGYRLADGAPAEGWQPARRRRRAAAWLLDVGLFVLTLGVGWLAWAWRCWASGTTPGKAMLGLTVFGTDTRRPAGRTRMATRALAYQSLALALGVTTLGVGWAYCVGVALGSARRTLYDEWSQVVLLQPPPGSTTRPRGGETGSVGSPTRRQPR